MSGLTATAPNPQRARYTRPGGPWTGPSLDARLSERPPRSTFLVDDSGVRYSGVDVAEQVAALAGALRASGVGTGDVVAWQLPNGADAALLPRACWRIGAVAAPLHHRAGTADCERMLTMLTPALVVAPSDVAVSRCTRALDPHGSWRTRGEAVHDVRDDPADGDTASVGAVLFTSGSSGAPKAVLHDTRALAYKATTMVATHGLGPDDAVLMPAPLAHISGMLNGVLVPGATPCKTVCMARWDPAAALDLIESERITFMVGPPTFFVSLMHDATFDTARVASLRLVSSGGAGVTTAFCETAEQQLHARVKRTYGSTEAPTIATSGHDDDTDRAHRHDGRAIGSVELAVVDPADDHRVPAGERGELLVRGPELCLGYADRADTDAAFTSDGWFRTGDLATLDEQGWLTIVGRRKEIVIRGGENISTAEVEEVLERHPAVTQACVVGVPDELMGERVCAFVVTSAPFDLEACRTWFASQGIAPFKAPERLEAVDDLPLLPSGKPDRAALRARVVEA